MGDTSVWVQVAVGVTIGAISGGGGWLFGIISAQPVPPSASVSPPTVSAPVGGEITFSVNHDAEDASIQWLVGGQTLGTTSLGACTLGGNKTAITCRFAMPSSFPVSAVVQSQNGLSTTASSAVSVDFPGGYYGFVFPSLEEPRKSDAYRLLLTEFDWVAIQQSASRPIILYDPDLGRNVYAVSHQNATPPTDRDALNGVRVMTGRFQEPGRSAFEETLADLGAVRLEMAFSEIYTALSTGLAGSSMLSFDSLDADLIGFQP